MQFNHLKKSVEECASAETITGGVVCVGDASQTLTSLPFGKMTSIGDGIVRETKENDIFLIASTTKLAVALGVLKLISDGSISLDTPVCDVLTDLEATNWKEVTLKHLLTHTAGVVDMLPEDVQLRGECADVHRFICVAKTYPLRFTASEAFNYSSMGFGLIGEIVEVVSGMPLRDFLFTELFSPLSLNDTYLGVGGLPKERISKVEIPQDGNAKVYQSRQWDSDYWRDFGAPWGGLHSSAPDFLRLMQAVLTRSKKLGIKPSLLSEFSTNQLAKECTPMTATPFSGDSFGLGVSLNHPPGVHFMPKLASQSAFGHGGATGCTAWCDPERELCVVIFTNQPGCFEKLIEIGDSVIKDVG